MELSNVNIYRITHLMNIPHILKYGITHKDSPNKNPDYKNIGDLSLIDNRSNKTVCVDNGVFDADVSLHTITLGNFIPFYFGVRMPMLYVTQHGGNFVPEPTHPSNIIYLVCSVTNIVNSDFDFFFTDGHATDNLTSFYDASKINDLVNIVDWNAVKSHYWGGDGNLNLKRKKQAEFLVSGDLPPDQIIGFGCYNNDTKDILVSFGVDEDKIRVIPQSYF